MTRSYEDTRYIQHLECEVRRLTAELDLERSKTRQFNLMLVDMIKNGQAVSDDDVLERINPICGLCGCEQNEFGECGCQS